MFVPVERKKQHLAMFPLWGVKREQDPYKVQTSPCVTAITRKQKNQTKEGGQQKHPTKPNNKKKQNPQKNTIIRTYALVNAAACAPMNSMNSISQRNKETKHTPRTSLQDHDEGAKQTKQSSVAETQDPPSQDPGDRNEKPTGHNRHLHSRELRRCNELGCRLAAGTLPW